MTDPLADVVTLLHPQASSTKRVSGAGRWRVRRSETGQPFYAAVLDGSCVLRVETGEPIMLTAGDFVLIPSAFHFSMSSIDGPDIEGVPVVRPDGEIRHGDPDADPDVRLVVGYCSFASPEADLLVRLLPRVVHVRGEPRLAALVGLVRDESVADRPARDVVLARLLEVMLIEALRAASGSPVPAGLVRGLADERIAAAIRRMHEDPAAPWSVAELARAAALSRSAFFDRFRRTVGVAPMEYLLGWRMALAKDLLRRGATVGETAGQVGYGSPSALSVAFTRYVGRPPSHYARDGAVSSG